MPSSILFITGSRSDFATLKNIFVLIKNSKKIKPRLLVTGSITYRGSAAVSEIHQSQIDIDVLIPINPTGMNDVFLSELRGISSYISKNNPDFVCICGDRIEALAGAVAATINSIPIFHIHGGDVTYGMIDDQIRHSITKMAAIHFPASPLSKHRISQMGEEPWRIFQFGSPDIDELKSAPLSKDLLVPYGVAPGEYALLIFHPETLVSKENSIYTKNIIRALNTYKKHVIIVRPNGDPGSEQINLQYEKLNPDKYSVHSNIRRDHYLALLKNAEFLIGNSSSGIIEAATFKTPVINLGRRQDGRERNQNIIDIITIAPKEIEKAIVKATNPIFRNKLTKINNVYGNGTVSKKIANKIQRIAETYSVRQLLYKKFIL